MQKMVDVRALKPRFSAATLCRSALSALCEPHIPPQIAVIQNYSDFFNAIFEQGIFAKMFPERKFCKVNMFPERKY